MAPLQVMSYRQSRKPSASWSSSVLLEALGGDVHVVVGRAEVPGQCDVIVAFPEVRQYLLRLGIGRVKVGCMMAFTPVAASPAISSAVVPIGTTSE